MALSSDWRKALGPGLLYAGAAVGVSHIVQSTRAGALYGFALLGFVVLVNVLKYPFFEFGARYTVATNNSLIQGYHKLGRPILWLFTGMTFLVMFPILAAITSVFTGVVLQLVPTSFSPLQLHALSLAGCGAILLAGRFRLLDRLMRLIMAILSLTTLIAAIVALSRLDLAAKAATGSFSWDWAGFLFLVAFAGWMPTPVDSAVWQSLWTLEKRKESGVSSWKAVKFDFNLGYWLSTVLAVIFVFIGAVVLYSNNVSLPEQGAAFAASFLKVYVGLLGDWATPVVGISIFATLFSTLLTVIDGYPRVMAQSLSTALGTKPSTITNFNFWVVVYLIGTWLLLYLFPSSMLSLVDFATSISFLTAPILGYWNFRLVMRGDMDEAFKPDKKLQLLSWLGLTFLTLFSLCYMFVKLGWLN